MILHLITYVVLVSIGVMVGYLIGIRVTEKKYSGGNPTSYGMNTELTLMEQQEEALNEAKRIINDKK